MQAVTRAQVLSDPASGARALFSRSVRVIPPTRCAANADATPVPMDRSQAAVWSNYRISLCQSARVAAYKGEFAKAREHLAKASGLGRLGTSRSVAYAERYIEAAELGEPWTREPWAIALYPPRRWA